MNNPPIILPGSSRAIATRTPALRLTMGYFIPPGFLSWLRGYSRLFGAAMIELRLTDIGVVRNKPGTRGVTSLILFRLVRQPGKLYLIPKHRSLTRLKNIRRTLDRDLCLYLRRSILGTTPLQAQSTSTPKLFLKYQRWTLTSSPTPRSVNYLLQSMAFWGKHKFEGLFQSLSLRSSL
jgi:hypothetical protein